MFFEEAWRRKHLPGFLYSVAIFRMCWDAFCGNPDNKSLERTSGKVEGRKAGEDSQ